jgi:LAO/AO transport system kinase
MLAINKADGENIKRAKAAAAEYRAAFHILRPRSPTWSPPVLTYSALIGDGIAELWKQIELHRAKLAASGEHAERRREQQVRWMWTMLDDRLTSRLRSDAALRARLRTLEASVAQGTLSPALAVEEIAKHLGL